MGKYCEVRVGFPLRLSHNMVHNTYGVHCIIYQMCNFTMHNSKYIKIIIYNDTQNNSVIFFFIKFILTQMSATFGIQHSMVTSYCVTILCTFIFQLHVYLLFSIRFHILFKFRFTILTFTLFCFQF